MKPKIPEGWIVTGWSGQLYPTRAQADRLSRWAGSLRFLWNRLLEREEAAYAADKTFLWKRDLQPIAVGMKREPGLGWLADFPAHAVLDTVTRLDGALRKMVRDCRSGHGCGFPRRKKKFVNEADVYCAGQATAFAARERQRGNRIEREARAVRLPKLGRVRLRGGAVPPEHKVLSARVWRDGDRWILSAQLACERPEPLVTTGRARHRPRVQGSRHLLRRSQDRGGTKP